MYVFVKLKIMNYSNNNDTDYNSDSSVTNILLFICVNNVLKIRF